jgi:hypothetical protein
MLTSITGQPFFFFFGGWEDSSLHVPTESETFLLSDIHHLIKVSPPTGSVSPADVVCRNIDIFNIELISLTDIIIELTELLSVCEKKI